MVVLRISIARWASPDDRKRTYTCPLKRPSQSRPISTASGGSLIGLKNWRTSSSVELQSTERILMTMWLWTSRSQRSGT